MNMFLPTALQPNNIGNMCRIACLKSMLVSGPSIPSSGSPSDWFEIYVTEHMCIYIYKYIYICINDIYIYIYIYMFVYVACRPCS